MPFSAVAGIDLRQSLRAAQPFQRLREPGTGDHLRPVGVGRLRRFLRQRDIGAGEQPHGLREAEAVLGGRALDFAEALHHAAQLFAIDFHPAPAHQRESIGLRQQLADLGGGQGFAVERDFHAEIEQRVLAESRGRLAADRARHPRPRRTVAPPRRRHAHHHPGALQLRDVAQKLHGLAGRPAQRMKDLARVDHGPSATGRSPTRAAREAAATADGPCWPRRRTRRSACPSGRCCALACADSRVV